MSDLEALLAQVEALQVQGSVSRLSTHWHPETRTRCLNAIRRMKKELKKLEEMIRHEIGEVPSTNGNLEEMIRHEIGEVPSTNGNSDVDTSASDITLLLAEDLFLNPQAAVSATGEEGAPRPRRR